MAIFHQQDMLGNRAKAINGKLCKACCINQSREQVKYDVSTLLNFSEFYRKNKRTPYLHQVALCQVLNNVEFLLKIEA